MLHPVFQYDMEGLAINQAFTQVMSDNTDLLLSWGLSGIRNPPSPCITAV